MAAADRKLAGGGWAGRRCGPEPPASLLPLQVPPIWHAALAAKVSSDCCRLSSDCCHMHAVQGSFEVEHVTTTTTHAFDMSSGMHITTTSAQALCARLQAQVQTARRIAAAATAAGSAL